MPFPSSRSLFSITEAGEQSWAGPDCSPVRLGTGPRDGVGFIGTGTAGRVCPLALWYRPFADTLKGAYSGDGGTCTLPMDSDSIPTCGHMELTTLLSCGGTG